MVKRAMTGGPRAGAPALPRQRRALRVVQATLASLAFVAGWLGYRAATSHMSPGSGYGKTVVLGGICLGLILSALWMGLRTVRGPKPPAP